MGQSPRRRQGLDIVQAEAGGVLSILSRHEELEDEDEEEDEDEGWNV